MKTKMTVLAAAAAYVVIQTTALAGQSTPQISTILTNTVAAPAAATAAKSKPLIVTPLSKSLPVTDNSIQRVGNISSRPWAETVGWDPGRPSTSYDSGGGKEQGLTLFWMGHEPWR